MAWQFEGCRVAGDGSDYRKGTTPSGNAWRSTRARAAPQSAGKWYYPIFLTQGGSEDFGIGFATGDAFQVPNSYIGRGAASASITLVISPPLSFASRRMGPTPAAAHCTSAT